MNKRRANIEGFSSASPRIVPAIPTPRTAGSIPLSRQQQMKLKAEQHGSGIITAPQTKQVNISIKFTVPTQLNEKLSLYIRGAQQQLKRLPGSGKSLKLPTPTGLQTHRHFKKAIIGAAVLVLVLGIWQAFLNKPPARPVAVAGAEDGIDLKTPAFKPLIPADKKNIRQKYDPQRRVISYNDELAGTKIVVSQQALPEAFKLDPEITVEEMAKKFNATTPIKAGGITAYAGKSADGPQSIVFHASGKLVFIYAPQEMAQEHIITYIKLLQ